MHWATQDGIMYPRTLKRKIITYMHICIFSWILVVCVDLPCSVHSSVGGFNLSSQLAEFLSQGFSFVAPHKVGEASQMCKTLKSQFDNFKYFWPFPKFLEPELTKNWTELTSFRFFSKFWVEYSDFSFLCHTNSESFQVVTHMPGKFANFCARNLSGPFFEICFFQLNGYINADADLAVLWMIRIL